MKYFFRSRLIQIAMFVIPLMVVYGCSANPSTQPSEPPAPSALPTESEPPSAPQNESSLLSSLTANETSVIVFSDENSERELEKFETLNIPPGDGVKSDDDGRAVLRFGDRHEIELFGGTEIQLDDAKLESGGSIFVRLKQIAGHTHVLLNELSIARVTLETVDSTITTLEQGTEFIICFAPGKLTCIEVLEGAVEVTSQGEKHVFREGVATYYTPGQPPQPPICARPEEVQEWLIQKRGPGEVQTLGQLVQSWPQEPCSAESPEPTVGDTTPATATATLPPTEIPTPTLIPTATVPPGIPYVRINGITIDDQQRYVVAYETYEYTEQLPGMHVHFFFDTVPPEQTGVPGSGPWILYGGPRPFTQYRVSDRPTHANQMCALVANADHSIQLNSGNCMDLP